MENKNTGGPAFPSNTTDDFTGMTIRDYFAGRISEGLTHDLPINANDSEIELLVRLSYRIADAMLKERDRE